jgi:hypothetical protein
LRQRYGMRRGISQMRRSRDHIRGRVRLCRPCRDSEARAPNMRCLGAVSGHGGRDAWHAVLLAQSADGAIRWNALTPSPPGAACCMSVSRRQWQSSGRDRCWLTNRQNSHAVGGRMGRHSFHHDKAFGGNREQGRVLRRGGE